MSSASPRQSRQPQSPGLPAGNPLVGGIARVLIALVFVHALVGKLSGFGAVAGKIAAKGLPFPSLLLGAAVVLLTIGSALLISGWRSRLGAVLLLVFLIPTSVIFHGEVGDPLQRIQLLKNVAIIGGLLLVANAPDARR
ncbi:DoxX family protein [Vulcanococcus limneticus]|uniref:DoxX family protein n=1 Tax=Vulcanococcus limneticus TaxID=2170428 RepID=UPI00398BE093